MLDPVSQQFDALVQALVLLIRRLDQSGKLSGDLIVKDLEQVAHGCDEAGSRLLMDLVSSIQSSQEFEMGTERKLPAALADTLISSRRR